MLSRKYPFQLGGTPTIQSCFPETKSTEGSDLKSHLQAFVPYKKIKNISLRDISHHEASPSTSVNIKSSSSSAASNSLVSSAINLNKSLSDVQNGDAQYPIAGENLTVLPGVKGTDVLSMLQNLHLKSVGPVDVLTNEVSGATSEQSMQVPEDSASSPPVSVPHSGEMRYRNHTRHIPLFLAALKGDWKTARIYLQVKPEALRARITRGLETALHIAAGARHTLFVEELVKCMSSDDLALQNKVGNTALCYAAASGITKIAEVMVKKNRKLPLIRGGKGATPLYMAVLLGHRNMVQYLSSVTDDVDLLEEDRIGILVAAITFNLFDVALDIIRHHPELAIARDGNGETALHVLSRKPTAFFSGARLGIWQRKYFSLGAVELPLLNLFLAILLLSPMLFSFKVVFTIIIFACERDDVSFWSLHMELQHESSPNHRYLPNLITQVPEIKLIYNTKMMHFQALELVKQLWQQILLLDDSSVATLIRMPRRLLFTAAELGIHEFITMLIQSYPDLIWKVDKQSRSIFHIAVAHRQEKVFNLAYEIGALGDFIVRYKDDKNNNILHLAGKLPPSNRLNTDSGAALQLRRELLWFKEVEKIVQPLYTEMKNSEGKTPQCLFTEEHRGLVLEGEKWMKDTASSCMVVATLIATVMFAAAFSIPGGNNDTGMPIFLQTRLFMVFSISDALALFFSATSILMFLSILTSRYAEEDFLHSLPNRLIIGLSTLFISIATMMIAFSSTLFISFGHGFAWVAIPIALVASIPVFLFALLQFPLIADIISHTYRFSIFCRPGNHLFY